MEKKNNNLDHLVNFCENNLEKLLQIYINERTINGDGILSIRGNIKENKVDVGYLINQNLDDDLKNKINELNITQSKAYFVAFEIDHPENCIIIEKELRT